jgi:hypothetical protein
LLDYFLQFVERGFERFGRPGVGLGFRHGVHFNRGAPSRRLHPKGGNGQFHETRFQPHFFS